ncbi:dynein light chain roadblock-type [Marchantia polymorpha subsp. ruderalis]
MTEAEAALQRITNLKDVVGVLIVDNDGNILRSTFLEEDQTVKYAEEISSLAIMTRSAIRELDPQNDIQMIRIKSLRHELIAVIDMQFTLLVAQQYPGFVPLEVQKPPEEEKKEDDEEF